MKTGHLSLVEELILLLLNEDSGYFHQVRGWNLNCAIASAVLADLALAGRIDTEIDTLALVDPTETGDPVLDDFLEEIASEKAERNTQFWIERLAPRSEAIVETTLDQLVEGGILKHHSGEFWSLSPSAWKAASSGGPDEAMDEFVKTRIASILFDDDVPHPRDAILVGIANACEVLHLIFDLDETAAARIPIVCKLDVVGRSIAAAVERSITDPKARRTLKAKPIPWAPLRDVLFNPHTRTGNIPALFADLAEKHGPVFRLRTSWRKEGMLVLAGPGVNRWVQRSGRSYLRSKDYLEDFEKVYGASRILPSMDGADHFRMRRAIQGTYSREALEGRLDEMYQHAKDYLGNWKTGDLLPAAKTCKEMMNAQFSHLSVGIDTQKEFQDLLEFKERSLVVHVQKVLPKFMLSTPGMRRRKKRINELISRIQSSHTPAQRVGCPRDIVDDTLSLHASDPQFLPATDLGFSVISPLIVSLYLGNAMSFALYNLLLRPELYKRIEEEADRVFANGDPDTDALSESEIGLTYRFFMESQRLYPIIPTQIRTVMNDCMVEGYELPVGSRVFIIQTAPHYMDDVFSDPFTFDVDRHLPGRGADPGPSYAPFGLGTHKCLGYRWVDLQLAVNLLMLVYYFRFEMEPDSYKLRINPFPTTKPSNRLHFRVAEKRHDFHPARERSPGNGSSPGQPAGGTCPFTGATT